MVFEQKHMNILLVALIVMGIILFVYKMFYGNVERFVSEINASNKVCDNKVHNEVVQQFTNGQQIRGRDLSCNVKHYMLLDDGSSNCAAPIKAPVGKPVYMPTQQEPAKEKVMPPKLKDRYIVDDCNKCEIRKEVFTNLKNKEHLTNKHADEAWDELYGGMC